MKKILLFCISVMMAANLFAQITTFQPVLKEKVDLSSIHHLNTKTIDTIWTYFDRSTSFSIYGNPDGGYVMGNGYYYYAATSTTYLINTAIAAHYDAITDGNITGFIAIAAAKNQVSTADVVTGVVYAVGADSVPTSTLGSVARTTADVDTTGGFTAFMLTTPVSAAADFMCSIEWPATVDDTLGFVSNDPAANNGAGEERARMKLSAVFGGTWEAVNYSYGGTMDADVMIFPIVDITTGADFMESNGLKIYQPYPNPSSDHCTLKFSINEAQNVNVRVFGLDGKNIFEENVFQAAGEHLVNVDLSGVAAGNYFYSIKTKDAVVNSMISVAR